MKLARRTFLRGVGTAIGLPILDAMTPAFASSHVPGGKAPVRIGWVYVPNGIDMANWTPAAEGALTELPRILRPLEPYKKQLLVLSNLGQNYGRALIDGNGDHARACGTYLTGVQMHKSPGHLNLGTSCDQLAAQQLGRATKLPSLELTTEDSRRAGVCDSYDCAYEMNIAWRSGSQPLPPMVDPRLVFERLFGSGEVEEGAARSRRMAMQRSILDAVGGDAVRLARNLGPNDRQKLDDFLDSVRSIELQIERSGKNNAAAMPAMNKPYAVPADFTEYYKLMADMLAIALQADLTRVFTWLVGREGSSRAYREIGISDAHHPLTHHQGNQAMLGKVTAINSYHMELFAYLIAKLAAVKEGDGTLLDNVMIIYGGGLSDGNRHNHDQLPLAIAGSGGGVLKGGRHVIYQRETPLTNLYVSMLHGLGIEQGSVGDSTGPLEGLSGLA